MGVLAKYPTLEKVKTIKFTYPVMDAKRIHFTDLTIHAVASKIKNEVGVRIECISYFEGGKHYSTNIATFLEITAPELYQKISDAVYQTAQDEFTP